MRSGKDRWGAAAVLVILVLLVYGRWYLREGKQIKPGFNQQIELRVWDKARLNQLGVSLPYQAWTVWCSSKINGCEQWSHLRAGDSLLVSVTWQKRGQANDGAMGMEVKAVNRIRRLRELTPLNPWWWIREIQSIRDLVLEVYRSNLSEPYNGLLAGIVLGVKSELPPDLYQALVETGTVHVVAASGYNISVVTSAILVILLIFFPRKMALGLALGGIGFYVIMAGAAPPIIRAGIMGLVLVLAQLSGRLYAAGWALGVSVLLMLVIWPWMFWSVSFMLSVAATVGVIWGTPKITTQISKLKCQILKKVRMTSSTGKTGGKPVAADGLAGELGVTLAATLATLPIILIFFKRLSLVAPIVNLLVLGLVPPIMALGGVMAVVGLVFPAMATAMAFLVYPLLWLFVKIVQIGAKWPIASVAVEGVNWWLALGWWLILAAWWTRKAK